MDDLAHHITKASLQALRAWDRQGSLSSGAAGAAGVLFGGILNITQKE